MAWLRQITLLALLAQAPSFSGTRQLSEKELNPAHTTPWTAFVDHWLDAWKEDAGHSQAPAASALEAMKVLHGSDPSTFYSSIEAKLDAAGMPSVPIVNPLAGCAIATPVPMCYPVPKWPPRLFSSTVPNPSLVIELYPFLGESTVP